MSKYQAYPEYKDSGVEWLGKIPSHWMPTELKRYATVQGGYAFSSDSFVDAGKAVIRIGDIKQDGSVSLESCKYINNERPALYEQYEVKDGDLLMAMTGATIGKAGWYKEDKSALLNQRVGSFKCNQNYLNHKFFWYVLNSAGYQEYIKLTAFGGAQPNISDAGMVGYKSAFPTNIEQQKIANFLDHETTKIDTLIEKQQQLIALLKEKRQAVISHAVTKGISSINGANAPMKNSGVEWLGDVPEHWNVAAIRRYLVEHRQGYYTTDAYVDDGTKLLRITDLRSLGEISISDCPNVPYSDTLNNYLLEEGDVVFARTGGAGSFGVIPSLKEEVAYASYLIRFRFLPKHFNTNYLRFMLVADSFQLAVKSNIHGGVTQNIHAEDIKDTFVASPPLEEQKEISLYLDKQSDKYSELISQADLAIQLMQERRTALISAAVTGKIDVRNWQAPAQNNEGT